MTAMRALALSLVLLAGPAGAAVRPSKVLAGISIDDRGRAAERALIEKTLAGLQGSALAREREDARRRAWMKVTVGFDPLKGPGDEGLQGRALLDAGKDAKVLLSEALLAPGAAGLPQALAHELYGHVVTGTLARRAGADHLFRLEEDEADAAVAGAVIARELGLEETPDSRLDALIESTSAFHAAVLFTDSPSRIVLSLTEARDPRAAIAARLRELSRRRRTLADRDGGYRVWRAAFLHFEKVHRMPPAAFAAARADMVTWDKGMTAPRRALLDAAEPHLRDVIPFFDTEDGLLYEKTMIALSSSAFASSLAKSTAVLAARLAALRKASAEKAPAPAEAPPAAPAGALAWGDIQELYDRDHRDFPGHWKNEARSVAPGQWEVP